ncbi:carboxypeptidase-like regulatory domain-containing protein [bacterium]|nr:carboxypeptidase-like regulatory domain-containing protein [bacterium]
MRKMFTFLTIVLIIVLASQPLFGASGGIKGIVYDSTTGDALAGANVFIEGTSIGTASNLEGEYVLSNVPQGDYTLKVTYIGYNTVTQDITIRGNQTTVQNIEMEAVVVEGSEVVITAQAVGQKGAINQQLASKNIVSIVSSARIQELPDANAAESIGRLPGVSLIRSGGQATQVVIRGISPEYSQITVAGVPIPANEGQRQIDSRDSEGYRFGGGRGVDMRMISSSTLDKIAVFKTNTPDMDAAVLGGTVDLGIRKARKSVTDTTGFRFLDLPYMPAISLEAQGGYTDLTNEYNNYKFDMSLERRFSNERFGIYLQGIIQKQNFTSNRLDANYTQIAKTINPDSLALYGLNLYFYPREEKRVNGTVTLDYEIPNGNLALTNLFSQSESNTNYFQQQYGLERGGNNIHYYANNSPNKLNLMSNILNFNQKTPLVDVNATLSHSYSENISPDSWTIMFEQLSTGTDQVDEELPPVEIAALAHQHVLFDQLELRNVSTSNSKTTQRELRAALDLSREFILADFLTLDLKTGGMVASTDRSHDYNRGAGSVWFGEIGERIVDAYPWLSDWGISSETNARLFITPFMDPDMKIGTFLDNKFTFDNKLNLDYMRRIKEIVVDYGNNLDAAPTGGAGAWVPDMFGNQASDYSGDESRSAGYLMGTFNIGQKVSVMAGVRYQELKTTYRANRFYNASVSNPYPNELPHIDTTMTKTHGYWLPGYNIKFSPVSWLSIRGAYSNTLAYPNFRAIIPIVNVFTGRVNWNNADLKPIRSENFDLQLSVYNNQLGLFTFGGFRKNIDDFVFFQSGYVNDPTQYEGLYGVPQYPSLNTKGYTIATYYNNPHRVELWGLESDWQTHFWYLPGVLSGLVLNVNYTHVFSEAKYPHTIVGNSGFPFFQPTYTDTLYTDRLINQPDDIVNVSLGFDYKGFSVLVSTIYQSAIFNSTNFWNALRTDKEEYLRWDIVAKQKLPFYDMEVFLNLNNLNGANDTFIVRGNGFRDTDESYGLTGELGFRMYFR